MKTSDFDYNLPKDLIAQTPIEPRDQSRLMSIDKKHGSISHKYFYQLPELLRKDDLLVFNDSRVIPARLIGVKSDTGTKTELLLLRRIEGDIWETLAKPGKKIRQGTLLEFSTEKSGENYHIQAEVIDIKDNGIRLVRFSDEALLEIIGHLPLPPYIHKTISDAERYQTVYSRMKGSAAAPTAGLHFTGNLLKTLQENNIRFAFVTLHIGLDTFQPIRVDNPANHKIHSEFGEVSQESADLINKAKSAGNKIIVVGTSALRVLESASLSGIVKPFTGNTSLYILPGYRFRITDSLITNFHLPKSTLLMLVSAFTGKELLIKAYKEAIANRYRFYSFGDAMFIH